MSVNVKKLSTVNAPQAAASYRGQSSWTSSKLLRCNRCTESVMPTGAVSRSINLKTAMSYKQP
jgi:hypothetical protein